MNLLKAKFMLTILHTGIWFCSYGQSDSIKNKYEYEICLYKNSKDKPKLIKNSLKGIGDTTTAFVFGRIIDNENLPLPYANVCLISLIDSKVNCAITDTLGIFRMSLKSGTYDFKTSYVGLSDYNIKKIELGTGHIREIEIKLANAGCFKTHLIQSDKPLDKKKLNRIEKRIRRRN